MKVVIPWKYLVGSLYWRGVLTSLDEFNFYLELKTKTPSHLLRCAQSEKLHNYFNSRPSWEAQAQSEWEWCLHHQVYLTVPGEEEYPFYGLEKPPLLISYMGATCWKKHSGLSIVGSRNPSQASLLWLETYLPRLLKTRSDLITVSGGAHGIDQKVHSVSLQVGRPTISILPSGLDRCYPQKMKSWIPHILAAGGAIMSSFAPQYPVYKSSFYKRNLLIAGISEATFIVEARRKSGSLLTAQHALRLGKSIASLPASPLDIKALGGLDLLYDGAIMVRDEKDLEIFINQAYVE